MSIVGRKLHEMLFGSYTYVAEELRGCVDAVRENCAKRKSAPKNVNKLELNFFFEEKRFSSPTQGLLSGTPALAAPSAGFTL